MSFKKYIQNNIIIIKLYITNNTNIGLSRKKEKIHHNGSCESWCGSFDKKNEEQFIE